VVGEASRILPSREQSHCSIQYGELAQLGERLVCNQEVTGSSPVFSTSLRPGVAIAGREASARRSITARAAVEAQGEAFGGDYVRVSARRAGLPRRSCRQAAKAGLFDN
jgi:hypothetical protein